MIHLDEILKVWTRFHEARLRWSNPSGHGQMPPKAPPPRPQPICLEDGIRCPLDECEHLGCAGQRIIYGTPEGKPLGTAPVGKPSECVDPRCRASTGDCYGPCWEREKKLAERRAWLKRRQRFPLAPCAARLGILCTARQAR